MADKRLIDANELISEFEWFESVVNEYKKEEVRAYIQRIKNAPTVDAVEVVHGRWNLNHAADYECSECAYENTWETAFCPNCGAKMDGERSEGE